MQTLLIIASCAWLLLFAHTGTVTANLGEDAWIYRVNLPQYSLGPAPYPHPQQNPYELFGSCYIREDHVEVTPPEQNQKGALWSKNALVEDNWQIDFVFRVGGQPGDFFGDGFAFWYILDRGHGGDALGGPNKFKGVGFFFDTYKNLEFNSKRHPYVYAMVNDGEKDYTKLNVNDFDEGCHAPFRNSDSKALDETEARLTYLHGTLSVVLRPVGSVDWMQCFEKHDVNLPKGGYLGVTAMTGDLVDRHEMMEIKVFVDMDKQPYSYAHENDVLQMPEMWNEMKHSGDVAREFDRWEKGMMEDTEFDPLEDEYVYNDRKQSKMNKFGDENDGGFYGDYYDKDLDDPYKPVVNSKRYKEIQKRKKQYKSSEKGGSDHDDDDDIDDMGKFKFTSAEMKSLSEILEGTEVGKSLTELQKGNREKIQMMRLHMEADIQEAVFKLTRMVRDIREREHIFNKRFATLAKKLHLEIMLPLEFDHKEQGRSWIAPFIVLFALIVALAIFGYSRYNQVMKTHLL